MKPTSNTNFVQQTSRAYTAAGEIAEDLALLLDALDNTQLLNLRDILKDASQSARYSHGQRDTAITLIRNIDAILDLK